MHELHLERQGRRILLRSRLPLMGLKSAVPGAYQRTDGVWTVPLNYESCLLLQEKYRGNGWKLIVGHELQRWAEGVKQARREMSALAASSDAKLHVLPRVAPRLHKAMKKRTYQRVGVRFVADTPASLVADEPGLGKTLIALGGILEAQVPGPYIVVAPKTAARSVWQAEIKRWLPSHHKVITFPEARARRERLMRTAKFGPNTWVIVHPEMLLVRVVLTCHKCGKITEQRKRVVGLLSCKHPKERKTKRTHVFNYPRLYSQEWGAIVADEAHETLIIRSGWHTQRRRGMDSLRLTQGGLRIALSGTPFDNKPHQLFGTLNWLVPRLYSGKSRWQETYWQKTGYTGWQVGEFRQEREQMLWDSLSSICIRRTKREVAPDLPPKQAMGTLLNPDEPNSPIGIWLDMYGAQAKAYNSMLTDSVARLKSGRLEAPTALEELTRLKQLASACGDIHYRDLGYGVFSKKFVPGLPSNKFQWTLEALDEWGYPSAPIGKVVIVSFYTSLLKMFQTGLETHYKTKPRKPLTAMISGKTTAREREKIRLRFNESGHEQILLLNLRAGGTAITIDSADRMIFLTETGIPDQQVQAEDRIHRVSNPRQCMYYYLRSIGTVDVGTAIANVALAEDSARLLDVRRGVEYLRYIIELSK